MEVIAANATKLLSVLLYETWLHRQTSRTCSKMLMTMRSFVRYTTKHVLHTHIYLSAQK